MGFPFLPSFPFLIDHDKLQTITSSTDMQLKRFVGLTSAFEFDPIFCHNGPWVPYFFELFFPRCKHSQLVLMHLIIYTYHTRDMENDSVTLTSYIFLHSINSIKRIWGYVTPCAINFKVQAWILCICAQKLWQYEGHSGMTILWDLGWACKPFLGKGSFIETSVDLWFHNVIWLANNKQDKVVWVIIADLGQ